MRVRALRILGVVGVLSLAQVATSAAALPGSGERGHPIVSPALTAPVVPPVTDPTVPRVAYTADTEGLLQYSASRLAAGYSAAVPALAAPAATEEGQPSTQRVGQTTYTTFVSTRDDPDGDVYLNIGGPAPTTLRLTCGGGTDTHPVVSPDGRFVAFASDRTAPVNNGHVNIWITGPVTATSTCASLAAVELPGQSGTNTWPAWVSDGAAPDGELVVYSSTRDNPLGDLYEQQGGFDGNPADPPVRLTNGKGRYGTTQPSVLAGSTDADSPYVLLCTTTKFRSDGSLGEVVGTSTGDTTLPRTVASAWAGDPPQSSDGVYGGAEQLAFTSTQTNPLGAVEVAARKDPASGDAAPYLFVPSSATGLINSADPAAPTSHPAWNGTSILVAARDLAADVDDAQSTDGTDARAIAHGSVTAGGVTSVLDSATPAYSPDGDEIAYSQRVGATPAEGRQLVVADRDGGSPTAVADQFVAAAAPSTTGVTDFDIEPAWSPDGKKIAFVRAQFRYVGTGPLTEISRSIWVADLAAGTAARLTPASDLTSAYYGHPSWSPDGKRIVVSHAALAADLAVTLAGTSVTDVGTTTTLTATLRNLGAAPAAGATVTIAAPPGLSLTPTADCPGTASSVVCAAGDLAARGSVTFTVSSTATADIATGAEVKATAATTTPDYDPSDNTATLAVSTRQADVAAAVTVPAAVDVGAAFTVSATITNNGPGIARNATLQVTAPAGATLTPTGDCPGTATQVVCQAGSPASGAARTFTLSATVSTDTTGATFTAAAASDTPDPTAGNNTASATLATRQADLVAGVTAPATVDVGAAFTVTGTLTNNGPGIARNALVYITAPTGISLTPTVPCPGTAAEVVCHADSMSSGAQQGFQLNAVASAVTTNATIVALATSDTPDPVPANNEATTTITARPADVYVAPLSQTNDVITIPVGNNGPAVARNASLYVTTTGGDVALTSGSSCTYNYTDLDSFGCTLGDLADGAPVQDITVDWTPPAAECGHSYTVTVTISSDTADSNTANNSKSIVMSEQRCIGLARPGRGKSGPAATRVVEAQVLPADGFVGDAVRELGYPIVTSTPQIWIIDATTGVGAAVTSCAGSGCAIDGTDPAWSPDGRRIAYDDGGQLSVATLTGSTASDVTALVGYSSYTSGSGGTPTAARAVLSAGHDPAWSPDGRSIYFAGQPAGQSDDSGIYAITPDGAGLRTVSQGLLPASEPAVAPSVDVAVTLVAAPAGIKMGHSSSLTATVTNAGPARALNVVLTITVPGLTRTSLPSGCTAAGTTLTCPLGVLAPSGTVTKVVGVLGTAVGAHASTATVTTTSIDRNPTNNTATAIITVARLVANLAVTITPAKAVAYVGGTQSARITVRNLGPDPAVGAVLDTTVPAALVPSALAACVTGSAPCALGTLVPGAVLTFPLLLHPRASTPTPGNYVATITATVSTTTAESSLADNTATSVITVRQPTIRLLPPIGSPGFVTLVYGENFPPGSSITLDWKPGITNHNGPFTVAADGTVQAPMLIVRWDSLGSRKAVAASTTGLFTPVSADMLVVAGSQAPPQFGERG